ncbi:hypothetical protein P8C59_005978 [Phyllachora maydis]|uniref:DUF7730 domain-containing protein n=1 Tax=Phyllachora maydis TaxID=1825666 RepID=A0AAD9MG37_9PEZI|nr:hypothetical protein P8C59_005978 [Phyllachora maydis]
MPRRPTTKASRTARAAAAPKPVVSSTPASEAEFEQQDEVSSIPIALLSLANSSLLTPAKPKKTCFPFLHLPSELRIKVYSYHFADTNRVIDLERDNYKNIHKKLSLLRTCRTIYSEAAYFFYSTRCFRLFPIYNVKTKKPILTRLKPRQRACLSTIELRLGPHWGSPPRSWLVNQALGLHECVNVRKLTVLVECDPSNNIFNGFRRSDGFYEAFCRSLLKDVMKEMPWLDRIYFDAWPSVKRTGPMMRGLLQTAISQGKEIGWGPECGWTGLEGEDEDDGVEYSHETPGSHMLDGAGVDVAVLA